MQITFRLPSKVAQYGYVEVTGSPEELGFPDDTLTPAALGDAYAKYLARYFEGEQVGVKDYADKQKAGPESRADAHELIKQELGGKVVEEMATKLISGSTEGDPITPTANPDRTQVSKPWEQKPEAQPKPWETEAKSQDFTPRDIMTMTEQPKVAPKVAEIDW